MAIPTKLNKIQFEKYVEPYLSKAKRGYVCKISLFKVFNYILYLLATGCQWKQLPIETVNNLKRSKNSMIIIEPTDKKEISYQAIYYHFRKWSRDGSLKKVYENSIHTIKDILNLSEINIDGSHTIAKKGGQSVCYQGRKKSKTSNIISMIDKQGYVIANTNIIEGNHNDLFEFDYNLKNMLKELKILGLKDKLKGSYLNADAGFDTKTSRKICFNHGIVPNIMKNNRNLKEARGRKRLFNKEIYNDRFAVERTFAWIDTFKRLLVRFERQSIFFLALHFIAFAMINLRNHFCQISLI
jgi:transposase